ncbi:hypothetical protein B0H34DRAFT_524845 [Crassisporium funariophilum]|nr:hypothetical protein B0H34DRAFT_524845 [Crassisporium funariophilum]
MFPNSQVAITGGNITYAPGGVHNYGLCNGFDVLSKHIAASAFHNSGDSFEKPKCHPNTRVAILKRITDWVEDLEREHPILWLHGSAGAGKSAILQTIADMLYQRLLIGSFFFSRTAPARNTHKHLIATLAYQLAISIPETRPGVIQSVENDPTIFEQSLEAQVQQLIVLPIQNISDILLAEPTRHPRLFVIDGLDECQHLGAQYEVLRVLGAAIRAIPFQITLLIASRSEHCIRNAFRQKLLRQISSSMLLDHSFNPDVDIASYFQSQFDELRQQHPMGAYLQNPWPSEQTISTLVRKSSGQFIYASTIMKFISSIRHNPCERLDIVCGLSPRKRDLPFAELDLLYSSILSNVEEINVVLEILGLLISGITGPFLPSMPAKFGAKLAFMSPRFIEAFFNLQPGDVSRLFVDLGSLLTIGSDAERIEIQHASLGDFLMDKSRSQEFFVDVGDACALMAKICIGHIGSDIQHIFEVEAVLASFGSMGSIFEHANPTAELCSLILGFHIPSLTRRNHDPSHFHKKMWIYLPSLLYSISSTVRI